MYSITSSILIVSREHPAVLLVMVVYQDVLHSMEMDPLRCKASQDHFGSSMVRRMSKNGDWGQHGTALDISSDCPMSATQRRGWGASILPPAPIIAYLQLSHIDPYHTL